MQNLWAAKLPPQTHKTSALNRPQMPDQKTIFSHKQKSLIISDDNVLYIYKHAN